MASLFKEDHAEVPMTEQQTSLKQRLLILFLAVLLMLMLFVMLKERLLHPSLTVKNAPQEMHFQASSETITRDMDEVGALMQMVKANPQDSALILKLCDALMRAERWDAAESFARRVTDHDANNFQAHFLLGVILHQRQNYQQAQEMLSKALAIHDDPAARYSLGILCLYYLQQQEQGLMHLKAALKLPDLTPDLQANIEEELRKHQKN
ncbi:MAG: tetratricopeptide repeat protein [Desulfovibrio sp.]|nr:tetratricopeptide repeat protein [Desulfovibrio sp.]